jgi:hypothetical protein
VSIRPKNTQKHDPWLEIHNLGPGASIKEVKFGIFATGSLEGHGQFSARWTRDNPNKDYQFEGGEGNLQAVIWGGLKGGGEFSDNVKAWVSGEVGAAWNWGVEASGDESALYLDFEGREWFLQARGRATVQFRLWQRKWEYNHEINFRKQMGNSPSFEATIPLAGIGS